MSYTPIKYSTFKSVMDDMKFTEIRVDRTFERVWKFQVFDKDGISRFDIRVYSTIDVDDDVTRSSGKDAIRCMLFNTVHNRIAKVEKKVHRTESALKNVRERCRELYKYLRDNRCSCGGMMIEREARDQHRFMGCCNYPMCKKSVNINVPQLTLKLNQ